MQELKKIDSESELTPHNPVPFRIDYETGLVEEAVLLSMAHHADHVRFRRELDRLYDIQDTEERESRFRAFHSSWFLHLGLGQPVEMALDERPIIARTTRCCFVIPARRRRDECAELFVKSSVSRSAGSHSVGLRLLPTSFLESARLLSLLRHEFLHIADMLDPAFEYEPSLPPLEDETMHQNLLQERYRALWDATIDGRLVHEGLIAPSCRARRLLDFRRTFPILGTRAEAVFTHFFDNNGHTHPQLLAYALVPENMIHRL